MTTIIWFSYRADFLPLTESLKAAKAALPSADLVVVDDANAPMSIGERTILKDLHGARVFASHTPRRGNLRGSDWITAQLSWMSRAAAGVGSKVVVKLDSDTLMLRADWLRPITSGRAAAVGWHSRRPVLRCWYGCAYALKTTLITEIREDVTAYQEHDEIGEDIVIGTTARRILHQGDRGSAWHRRLIRSADSPNAIGLGLHNWSAAQRDHHLANQLITFGPNPSGSAPSKVTQAEVMQSACKAAAS